MIFDSCNHIIIEKTKASILWLATSHGQALSYKLRIAVGIMWGWEFSRKSDFNLVVTHLPTPIVGSR